MLRRRLIGEAGDFLAWLMAAGCGSSSTPAAKSAGRALRAGQSRSCQPRNRGGCEPEADPGPGPNGPFTSAGAHDQSRGCYDNGGRPRCATAAAPAIRRRHGQGPDRAGGLAGRSAGIRAIEAGGYLRPLAVGKVSVRAVFEGQEVAALINVEPRENRSWDFASDVVHILPRLGCNTGSCHGRADGQNGFHLSLSGYDPDGDYQSPVREGGQRSVALLDPEQSLFLTKATGRTPPLGIPGLARKR